MKLTHLSLTVAALLPVALTAGCNKNEAAPTAASQTAANVANAAIGKTSPDKWETISLGAEGITLAFPGKPQKESLPDDGEMWFLTTGDYTYMLEVVVSKEKSPDAMMDAAFKVHSDGIKMKSTDKIDLGGHPGRNVVFLDEKGKPLHEYMVVKGSRVYTAVAANDKGNIEGPDFDQFLKSFSVAADKSAGAKAH